MTGAVVLAWFALALGRAWQVDAGVKDVAPYLYAPLLIVAGGWLGCRARRRADPALAARAVIGLATFVTLAALFTDHHGRGTTGYANANAALAVQLIAMAGLISLNRDTRRLGLLGVAAGMAALLANVSQGGTATGVIVLGSVAVALTVGRATPRWLSVVLALVIYLVGNAVLVWLARAPTWPDRVVTALTSTRKDMWNSAWGAFRRAETFGHGPGGYVWVNPWAHDPETASAHSLPLQVAAELGGVGLVLLMLMFLCGLAWAAAAHSPQASLIAVAAWTALATHAHMDHLLEYWPVPLAAGLVLGFGLKPESGPKPQQEVI